MGGRSLEASRHQLRVQHNRQQPRASVHYLVARHLLLPSNRLLLLTIEGNYRGHASGLFIQPQRLSERRADLARPFDFELGAIG